ncbi:MAG: hypothetical protein JNK67_23910 [Alphaproteobacteria bacterium]|nr:hypothetical protein [Alphaproteobacteria bacterium]
MRDEFPAERAALTDRTRLRLYLFVVAVLASTLLLLAARPLEHVFSVPITEDAYYALSVARNIASGHGFAIEPGLVTNGFQPMFTVLEAAAFVLGGDDAIALRWVVVLSWVAHVGAAGLAALVAGDAWPAATKAEYDHRRALAALLYLAAPLMLNHAYNGLETGATLFFYLALARALQIGGTTTRLGAVLCGGLGGLLVLARIDAAIVVTVLAVAIAVRGLRRGPIDALARGALFGLAALAVSLPWWAFNIVQFGSPMPTSGLAQQGFEITLLRAAFAATALGKVLVPWLYFGSAEGSIASLPILDDLGITLFDFARWGAALIFIVLVTRASNGAWRAIPPSDRVRESVWAGQALAVGFAVIVAYYALNFTAYWFYYRYFAPLIAFSVVIAAISAGRISARERGRWVVPAAVVVACLQSVALIALAWNGVGLFGQSDYRDQVALVNDVVPPGETVAAGQSGTLGFFRAHVVNLDGKVNRDAIGQQGRSIDYLRERGVRWFCDWPHYARKYLGVALDPVTGLPGAEGNGWRLVAVRGYFFLYEDASRAPVPPFPAGEEAIAMSQRMRRVPRLPR